MSRLDTQSLPGNHLVKELPLSVNGPATQQQERVLIAILRWVEEHGDAPLPEEIAGQLGLDADTVSEEVAALKRDGWVTVERDEEPSP